MQFTYDEVMRMQHERVSQGKPPLGPIRAVTDLFNVSTPLKKIFIHPDNIINKLCVLGDINFRSDSPTHYYYVLFQDDGEVAYFYAAQEDYPDNPIVDAMQIYNTGDLSNQEEEHSFHIVWSEDGLKAALLINNQFHAVYDFEQLKGYCRSQFPPPDPDKLFGEFAREWNEECTEPFRIPSQSNS